MEIGNFFFRAGSINGNSGIFFDYWAGSKKRNRIFSLIIGRVRDRIADKSGLLFLFL